MKKRFVSFFSAAAFCSAVLLPGFARAEGRFSLRLQAGWAHQSAGDVNPGTQAAFDWYENGWPMSEGGYRAVHGGYELGGDIVFELTPWLGVGVGGGYLKSSRTSHLSFWLPDLEIGDVNGGVSSSPMLSAVPIRLGIYFTVPLSKKFNFHADAGASCYLNARYNDGWHLMQNALATVVEEIQVVTRAEKKNAPLGFQGGIGLEYKLQQNLFLYIGARGRYGKFRGLKGSSVIEIYEAGEGETTLSEQGILYYEAAPMLTGSPRLLMVQSDPPDGPGGEPRQAVIDFSGVSLQVGIRIRL